MYASSRCTYDEISDSSPEHDYLQLSEYLPPPYESLEDYKPKPTCLPTYVSLSKQQQPSVNVGYLQNSQGQQRPQNNGFVPAPHPLHHHNVNQEYVHPVQGHSSEHQRPVVVTAGRQQESFCTHIILSCIVFWLCGFVFGFISFFLASK